PGLGQNLLDLTDAEHAEVEHARRQDGVGPGVDCGRKVIQVAGPTAGDHRNVHGGAHGSQHVQVVAVASAVGVHGVHQDLTGAEFSSSGRPLDGVDAGAAPPAV